MNWNGPLDRAAEHLAEHIDDELHRVVVVVEQDDIVGGMRRVRVSSRGLVSVPGPVLGSACFGVMATDTSSKRIKAGPREGARRAWSVKIKRSW